VSPAKLRIVDCGFFKKPCFFNPQSAIRNPQFRYQLCCIETRVTLRFFRGWLCGVWVSGFIDGQAANIDAAEIGCADAQLLGQQEMVVAIGEGRNAARGAGIGIAHYGNGDRIG
jgi:hypothetical protein